MKIGLIARDEYARCWRYSQQMARPKSPPKPCSVDDCQRTAKSSGLCGKHYQRLRNSGSPTALRNNRGKPVAERFLEKIEIEPETECWLWTATTTRKGYGMFSVSNGMVAAHVWSYVNLGGHQLEPGREVDHLCHGSDSLCPGGDGCPHRRCVNPDHLEAVDRMTNALRGRSRTVAQSARTHCIHGHPFDHRGQYGSGIVRHCAECARRRAAEQRQRRKAAG